MYGERAAPTDLDPLKSRAGGVPLVASMAGAPAAPGGWRGDPSPDEPAGGVLAGELTSALIREWAPLLKPAGLGLLVALHSFEEPAPSHPFFGWAHCTQNALAAYCDSSQDSIARYTHLLRTCGLLQVVEVETVRGRQKLYRVARGLPLPSLALLEHLLFDADSWTRKHTAWLVARLAPLGTDTELTRLVAILRRAYRAEIDARGVATIVEGRRLARPGSFVARPAPVAYQADLLPVEPPTPPGRPPAPGPAPRGVAARGAGPAPPDREPATGGLATGSTGVPPAPPNREPATGGLVTGSTSVPPAPAEWESATGGLDKQESGSAGWAPAGESAASGAERAENRDRAGRESARGGVELPAESARGGLGDNVTVIVDRSIVKNDSNENENDTPVAVRVTESAPSGPAGEPAGGEALLHWGIAALGDGGSLEWHRRCLAQYGAERYRWAVETTCRARGRSSVANPGAYFTSLLQRRGGPAASPLDADQGREPVRPPSMPQEASQGPAGTGQMSPPHGADHVGFGRSAPLPAPLEAVARSAPHDADVLLPRSAAPASPSSAESARLWNTALLHLRVALTAEEYARTMRYAVLLELDRAAGWALLGLPIDHMREQVATRLAARIAAALSQVCGAPIQVAAVVLPGQGRLAGAMPTLAAWLAAQAGP